MKPPAPPARPGIVVALAAVTCVGAVMLLKARDPIDVSSDFAAASASAATPAPTAPLIDGSDVYMPGAPTALERQTTATPPTSVPADSTASAAPRTSTSALANPLPPVTTAPALQSRRIPPPLVASEPP
ncbi:MAG: hypothetical protein AB7L17_23345, partial [Ilumatobacteraceae bacterium]